LRHPLYTDQVKHELLLAMNYLRSRVNLKRDFHNLPLKPTLGVLN
jgi:hypothetical protein